jgi:hypothetical protein
VDDASAYAARSCSAILPPDVDWKVALADWHAARTTDLPSARVASDRGYAERQALADA